MFSFLKRKKKNADAAGEEYSSPAPVASSFQRDDDDDPPLPIVEDFPQRRSINLRPVLMGLLVLVLGGGLGTGAYVLSSVDLRDIIGLLDVADRAPKLSMQLPGPDGGGRRGSLITPPGAGDGDPPTVLPVLPEEPPAVVKPAVPAIAAPPEVTPPLAAATPPAVVDGPEPEIKIGKKAPVTAMGGPGGEEILMPSARPADMMPSFGNLPARTEVVALPAAPVKELLRDTRIGPLPVVAPDGRQSWQLYARPFKEAVDRPRVAVVVTDLGLDKAATEAAIAKLPAEVTLAFSPYATDLAKWIKKARDSGHEVLIGLPSEPAGFPARDPGPLALMLSLSPEDNLTRLETVLAKAGGYTGVVALGTRFTGSSGQLAPVLAALRERGLLYIGDGASGGDRTPPYAGITTVIDRDLYREAIEERLAVVAAAARDKGRAVAIAGARPVTLDRLVAWMNRLSDQGVVAAPASAVVQPPPLAAVGGKS
jgi:polysaccharide deacetylase 2 family uncharacterized protein YibQ